MKLNERITMDSQLSHSDFIVIGAGIIGLTIAQALRKKFPDQSILILEKESGVGKHSSGRNSGVLHSGIYYPPGTLKAKVCNQGARLLKEYCKEKKLPFNEIGKILVPVNEEDTYQLDVLYDRGIKNGVIVHRIDAKELNKLEPDVRSAGAGEALFVPMTTVASPKKVIQSLLEDLQNQNVDIRFGEFISKFDSKGKKVICKSGSYSYGHLINAAGLHADVVAHQFDVGHEYTLLPFKGLYWKLDPRSNIKVNHLVYPVPDLRVPFLGVHTTTNTEGEVFLGPTAVPAFGRENYSGIEGIQPLELVKILRILSFQILSGRDGFRRLAWQEGRRYFKPWFWDAAKAILPKLEKKHLIQCDKVGIRAQMYHRLSGSLSNDFVIEKGESSTHVLNAISPAWTCSFPFAEIVVNEYL